MTTLIGLTGLKGHGKSTVARLLQEMYKHDKIVEFALADALKDDVANLYGIDRNIFDDPEMKETIMPVKIMGPNSTYRNLLQTRGDFMRKKHGPDVFINVIRTKIEVEHKKGNIVVISDIRMPNEFEFIRQRGGILLRVIRSSDPLERPRIEFGENVAPVSSTDKHVSETLMNAEKVAYTIVNSGSIKDLSLATVTFAQMVIGRI
jgi:energy-coupling factor transporter ATP-binding protein EcfA2